MYAAGRVDFRVFSTAVYRTGLIVDPDALALLDAQLARFAPRWTTLSWKDIADLIDRWVGEVDPGAVRGARRAAKDGRLRLGA